MQALIQNSHIFGFFSFVNILLSSAFLNCQIHGESYEISYIKKVVIFQIKGHKFNPSRCLSIIYCE
jgi:hypothetical protein